MPLLVIQGLADPGLSCFQFLMLTENNPIRPEDAIRYIPENWLEPMDLRSLFPHRDRPLTVDVGSGKARFILQRAATDPETNYFGIDRMLKRIRKTGRKAARAELKNIRLLRLDAYYTVTYLIPPASVDTYYILFPDPWPKKKHSANRLMNPRFIDALARTLVPGGQLHFATDHQPYFAGCMDMLVVDPRFSLRPTWAPTDEERTDFELMFRDQKPIGRASFQHV